METTDDLTWRKSSRSGDNGGNCVEVATPGSEVRVRDSKLGESSPILRVDMAGWRVFLDALPER